MTNEELLKLALAEISFILENERDQYSPEEIKKLEEREELLISKFEEGSQGEGFVVPKSVNVVVGDNSSDKDDEDEGFSGNVGSYIFGTGAAIMGISAVVGVLMLFASFYLGMMILVSGVLGGLCMCGLGKIVKNTDELVKIARENKKK